MAINVRLKMKSACLRHLAQSMAVRGHFHGKNLLEAGRYFALACLFSLEAWRDQMIHHRLTGS